MKPIQRNRNFEKNFKRRISANKKLVTQFNSRFELFIIGIRDAPINDHSLSGKLSGKRAFSISGDIRVLYRETDDAIIFIDIGTHSQVYR